MIEQSNWKKKIEKSCKIFLKRKSPTPLLLSHVGLNLGPLSQHHCVKDMLPMKIYPYLSDRHEINETDVKYVETCNLTALTR